ncbi:unnamed protein product [Lepeophtheirus salmonis]|uniref:(salmon louse) hypothetical protein n=1 Tax=Lepeophtheirus salmonis TaxID=72036 RepID=A0A7R8D3Q2_LEPSM|nr:unnamed protein product [Lepeophtheirus salmonis]CAF3014199.1 unnamed protein product [Lepeophtheirus salmonis]
MQTTTPATTEWIRGSSTTHAPKSTLKRTSTLIEFITVTLPPFLTTQSTSEDMKKKSSSSVFMGNNTLIEFITVTLPPFLTTKTTKASSSITAQSLEFLTVTLPSHLTAATKDLSNSGNGSILDISVTTPTTLSLHVQSSSSILSTRFKNTNTTMSDMKSPMSSFTTAVYVTTNNSILQTESTLSNIVQHRMVMELSTVESFSLTSSTPINIMTVGSQMVFDSTIGKQDEVLSFSTSSTTKSFPTYATNVVANNSNGNMEQKNNFSLTTPVMEGVSNIAIPSTTSILHNSSSLFLNGDFFNTN